MIFTPTSIPGLFVIELEKREDARGYFARAWCAKEFTEQGLPAFVQTNMSMSRQRGIVRGLHWQVAPHGEAKYLRCIRGTVFDVSIDVRPESPTYKQWIGFELSSDNRRSVFVPEGLAHGYQALTDDAEVIYSSSCAYAPGAERGIRWDDPAFNIEWPIRGAIVSDKDKRWANFAG